MYNILICDDEKDIVAALKIYLSGEDYRLFEAYDGAEALRIVEQNDIHLILMDVMMPKLDGIAATARLREKSNVPIILLTAKSESGDKVLGLNVGADDYVTKPFDVKELLARIHAVMRRTDADAPVEKKLTYDKLVINLESYELIVDGKKIDTPPKEMELLYHLAASPNRVFTRNQLLDEVWGFDYFGDSRTVDVHVKRLREKLEGVSDKWCLKTVWGVGYKFEVTE